MDDRQFEERLKNLKNAYDKMPTVSSTNTILKNISSQEKPIQKRRKLKLPYVASFIGVLLIGGLIGGQLLSQTDFSTGKKETEVSQQPPTEEQIEAAKNELRGLFERKVDELGEKLDFEDVRLYRFVQETNDIVTSFEERTSFINKKELTNHVNKVKDMINRRISLPQEEFDYLIEKVKDEKSVSDEEIFDYMDKLDAIHENLNAIWHGKGYAVQRSGTVEGTDPIYVDMLNSKNVKVGDEAYIQFVENIVDFGYVFYSDKENMIHFEINTDQIIKEFEGEVSEEIIKYLESKSYVRNLKDVSTVSSVEKDIIQKLVTLEQLIIANPTFRNIDDAKSLYRDMVGHFLWNNNNETLAVLPELYPNSEVVPLIEEVKSYKEGEKITYVPEEIRYEIMNNLPNEFLPFGNDQGITLSLFPLTEQMVEVYNLFKGNNEWEALSGIIFYNKGTFELVIARLYLYALANGDYETAYTLTDFSTEKNLPDLGTFKANIIAENIDYYQLSKEVVRASRVQEGQRINYILSKRNGEKVTLQMSLKDGFEKVAYPAFPAFSEEGY
ncbi:hypothetical protein [Metabacillus malikii]|uniref:Uncharacterized protein n=1 Tax=Metabacillus malikii TaxID=1504265 RepID=A0ABT9ZC35_9BACI|nr:hypothetical protein [Metabacillus malikii]MDQ0229802.1 hypothetical protein [Metabacillus malikii]